MLTQAEKDQFFELLRRMSIMDAAEMKRRVEDELDIEFKVSTSVPIYSATPTAVEPTRVGGEAPEPVYDITLASPGVQRIAVMKLVRELLDLSLEDAKATVDHTPEILVASASVEEVREIERTFKDIGAELLIEKRYE